ncbi:MAG: GNAT family N-acetyltransferase [Intrasporangiaceae bacterium]|nr:GNAT family N-acetyltransferase [Intrasporangiaceae bacterium]
MPTKCSSPPTCRSRSRSARPSPSPRPPPTTGEQRTELPGILLAAGQPAVGFAHVIDLRAVGRSGWHLEQIAVHPSATRQGVGTMLLRAAMGEVLDRGHSELTLMTYAHVAWNAPWYAREGFTEISPAGHPVLWDRLAPLREAERGLGLEAGGRRIGMVNALADEPRPRAAVSVIPVRSRRGVLETFVQHRALTMDFAPGAVVFPGGRVDPVDETVASERAIEVARACAVREVAEEAGAVIDPGALIPWDRWVTPVGYPRRFDVDFFLLPVSAGEEFLHQTDEATHSEWLAVADLVRATEAGSVRLVPPTRTIVDELSALGTLDAVVGLRPMVRPVRHDLTAPRPRR